MATKEQKEEVKLLSERLEKVGAISAVAESAGGKTLVTELLKDVVNIVETLTVRFKELTHNEFIGLCAEMKNKLDLAQVIAHSPANARQARKELTELLVATGEEMSEEMK